MKALRFLMVLCLSFVLTNKMSYGQEAYIDRWYSSPFFNRLTSDDGLSSPIINAIHQDFLGFMWFGTANGLDRYDGYEIRSYRYDMDNPETISNNTVVEIFEDSKHRFWVGTTNGLNLYNREKNRFIRMTHSPENQQTLTHNQIEGIEEDTEGNIWIATYNGLNRWNESDSTFTRFLMSPDEDDAFSKIHSLLVDQSGDLWIGTQFGGLCKFNRSTGICDEVYINKSDDPNSIPSNFVWDLFEDKSGNFFVSTFNQDVSLFDRKTGLFNNLRSLPKGDSTIDQSHAWVIEEGIDGKTWFGMANRLLIWDGDVVSPNKFISIKENPNDRERSISSSNILSIFRSENGIVWVGSRSGGVNYISKRDIRFFRYNNRSDGSVLNKVSSFAQNKDGLIWIGADGGGISILDEDKNVVRPFKTKSTPLKSDAILSILPDDQGMWIGAWAGGVCYYNNTTEDIEYNISDICSITIDNVFDIQKDSKGVLWIATWDDGLISYDPYSRKCTVFNSDYDDNMGISGNDITAVYVDSQDRIWISIYGLGFDVYDQNTQTFEHFQPVNTVNGLANDNIINCFREGIHGEMWIGSQGSGLLKFDIETGDFTPFKSILGLPKDEVNSLVVRENGIIWMGTNFGLYQFNPYSMEVNHYDKTAGVIGNNLGLNSALLTSKEGMYFGGLNGMNYFHPDSLQQNKEETALLFTDFKVFNKTIDLSQSESNGKDITVNDQINLSYKASVFSICFAALNYQNTANCTYKYKLVGFDKDWSITNAQNRTVTYTNLDAGEYDFQVLATNSDGKWNNTPASIKIFISPPFWETYWFRIAVIVLILGTGIAIHSFRLRYLNQRNVILENEITERTKEIKAKNDALIEAVDELKSTQTQLIVSEKMAALGQLTASVSHEVNTPLGTINSAVDSIKANFPQVIEQLPELTKLLNDKQLKAFMVILKNAENAPSISTQETRRFKKAMRAKLDEMGIRESNMLSSYLNHLNTDVNSQECLTLLKHKDVLKIFDIASKIVNINNLTGNISASVQQASKVAFALKKYSHSSYNHSNEKIDLKENILSVFTIFKNQLQQVKVNLDIPDGVHITGRPSELSQVWLNLIQNAVHALKGIGEIDILVQPSEEKVITSIKDNGMGIPKDIQQKVFDPFFTTKPYGQGSGLGLDIVNKIISKHQGTITFESNNSGTVFKVELPYESERE